jgi:hypothetical protein
MARPMSVHTDALLRGGGMKLYEQVCLVLEAGAVEVRVVRHRMGKFGTISGDIITIDIRQDDPVITLIHEVLHYIYPDASESWVEARSVKMREKMSEYEFEYIRSFLEEGGH